MRWGLSHTSRIILVRFYSDLNVSHLLQACGVILDLLRQQDNHADVFPLVWKLQHLCKNIGEESVFPVRNDDQKYQKHGCYLQLYVRVKGKRKLILLAHHLHLLGVILVKTRDNRILVP